MLVCSFEFFDKEKYLKWILQIIDIRGKTSDTRLRGDKGLLKQKKFKNFHKKTTYPQIFLAVFEVKKAFLVL